MELEYPKNYNDIISVMIVYLTKLKQRKNEYYNYLEEEKKKIKINKKQINEEQINEEQINEEQINENIKNIMLIENFDIKKIKDVTKFKNDIKKDINNLDIILNDLDSNNDNKIKKYINIFKEKYTIKDDEEIKKEIIKNNLYLNKDILFLNIIVINLIAIIKNIDNLLIDGIEVINEIYYSKRSILLNTKQILIIIDSIITLFEKIL